MILRISKLLFLFSLLAGSIQSAHAEKVLFFSPTRLELSDRDKVATINITNLSAIARSYSITVEDLVMTTEGVTRPVESFDYSAKRMLRYVPRSFVLQPNQRQTIRIMARLQPDTAAGQYHSHLRFLENISMREEINKDRPNQTAATIQAPLSYAAAIPVVITKGEVKTSVGMKNVSVARVPGTDSFKIDMMLTREGNGQGTAYIDTEYLPPSGEPVKATVKRTAYIYRELDERKNAYDFSAPEGTQFEKGGKFRVLLYDRNDANSDPIDEVTLDVPL